MGLFGKKEEAQKEVEGMPRPKGRKGIDSPERNRFSYRAFKGKLEVIRKKCPYCHHHKALKTDRTLKCSRCGRDLKNG